MADDAVLDSVIDDAELVGRMSARLGKPSPPEFYAALAAAKRARSAQSEDRPEAAATLQRSLGGAVAGLAPVTFANLKAGWDPFDPNAGLSWTAIFYGVFCILLILVVCWCTLLYNRASSIHATLVEIQAAKTNEQLVHLVAQSQINREQLKSAIESGKPEPALEAFYQGLRDIKRVDEKQIAFATLSGHLLSSPLVRPILALLGLGTLAEQATKLGLTPAEFTELQQGNTKAVADAFNDQRHKIEQSDFKIISQLFDKIDLFNIVVDIQMVRPRNGTGFELPIIMLRESMNLLGTWMLPFLYGMLGGGIYHMRRYLDPLIPNPHGLRSAYRMILGGFAGIVIVWVWTPTPLKPGEPAFASLSGFSIAFLMGFSTDIFFQALDRLVLNLSQWINGAPK